MKEAQEKFWKVQEQVQDQICLYNDLLLYYSGGDVLKRKTVKFQRTKLYEEIWEKSLSAVSTNYGIPNQKLKEACQKANIPLPTLSYWGKLHAGIPVKKAILPQSLDEYIEIVFSIRDNCDSNTDTINIITEEKNKESDALLESSTEIVDDVIKPVYGSQLYERETLYNEVWKEPVTSLAAKYGISDVMLHKICKTLNVPVPPRGYWAKKQAGKEVEQEPLPETNGPVQYQGHNNVNLVEENLEEKPDETLMFLPETELSKVWKTCLDIKVDLNKRKYHHVIMQHSSAFKDYSKKNPRDQYAGFIKDSYRRVPEDEPPLYGKVSENSLPRIYRILDALYAAIEKLGGNINKDLSVLVRGEHVSFTFTEGQEQVKHVLTKDEEKKLERYEIEKRRYSFVYEPRFRKYDYIPNGRLTFSIGKGKYIRDTEETGIESRVGDMLHRIYVQSEKERIDRLAREEEQRKREEEQRQRELKRKLYNEEVDKINALKNEALDYETACRIRAYANAVAEQSGLSPEKEAWIKWANEKADWYDPTMDVDDPILGQRNHSKPSELEKKYY